MRFTLVFDAGNSYFLDAAGANHLDESINAVFIRAAEMAIRAVNTPRIGVGGTDEFKVRDGNGNMIGTLKVHHG